MKSAARLAVVTDEFGIAFDLACKEANNLGIKHCELRNIDGRRIGTSFSGSDIGYICKTLHENNISVSSISPGFSKRIWTKEIRTRSQLDELSVLAEVADQLECREIISFGFRVADGVPPPIQWLVDYFGDVARHAQSLDVLVSLENHSSCAVATSQELLTILSQVDSAHLRAIWDPANDFLRSKDAHIGLISLPRLYKYISAVHVKDISSNGDGVSLGDGSLKWFDIVSYLCEHQYSGRLTLEPHRRQGVESVAGDLFVMNQFLRLLSNG